MVAAATVGHILFTVTGTVSRYMELKAKSNATINTTQLTHNTCGINYKTEAP